MSNSSSLLSETCTLFWQAREVSTNYLRVFAVTAYAEGVRSKRDFFSLSNPKSNVFKFMMISYCEKFCRDGSQFTFRLKKGATQIAKTIDDWFAGKSGKYSASWRHVLGKVKPHGVIICQYIEFLTTANVNVEIDEIAQFNFVEFFGDYDDEEIDAVGAPNNEGF